MSSSLLRLQLMHIKTQRHVLNKVRLTIVPVEGWSGACFHANHC